MRATRILEVVSVVLGTAALFGTLGANSVARAEEPILASLELQGATALTTPQSKLFGPGVNLALAVRLPVHPLVQLGVELRAGLLSEGARVLPIGQENPGVGSFELGMAMVRLKPLAMIDHSAPQRALGLFVDVGAGGGFTGSFGRLGFQAGLGYGFGIGWGLSLGPTLRYLQVIQPTDALSSRDARLVMYGVELTALDAREKVHHALPEPTPVAPPPAAAEPPPPPPPPPPAAEPVPECPPEGCVDPNSDRDGDHILDVNDKCPDEPETVNGQDDEDGCPDQGEIVLENDRIVLDAQVLFDAGAARVKHAAWRAMDAIAKLIKQHPEWQKVRIEGHADASGPDDLNQQLSERRARNAMKHLIGLDVPAEKLEAHGYGASQPRDKGTSEEARKRNRRVEFVVIHSGEAEAAAAREVPAKPEIRKHEAESKPQPEEEAKPAQVVLPEVDVQTQHAAPEAPQHEAAPKKQPSPPPPPAAPEPPKSGLKPSGLSPMPAEKHE